MLHEEPNAQDIPPHRYLTFINHTGWIQFARLSTRRGTSRAIELRNKASLYFKIMAKGCWWLQFALSCSLLRKKSICQLCGLSRRADFVLITNQNVSELSATGFYLRNGSKLNWWTHVLFESSPCELMWVRSIVPYFRIICYWNV